MKKYIYILSILLFSFAIAQDDTTTGGKLGVEWQGRTLMVPLNEVRPFNPLAFFFGANGAKLALFMNMIDKYSPYTSVFGKVPAPTGLIKTSATTKWPELASDIFSTCKHFGFMVKGKSNG